MMTLVKINLIAALLIIMAQVTADSGSNSKEDIANVTQPSQETMVGKLPDNQVEEIKASANTAVEEFQKFIHDGSWYEDFINETSKRHKEMVQSISPDSSKKQPLVITTKDDENSVNVTITIDDAQLVLEPKMIDLTNYGNDLHGSIQLSQGMVTFFINSNSVQVNITQETKEEKNIEGKAHSIITRSSQSKFTKSFPVLVDIAQVKAEVNKNTLLLTFQKKNTGIKIPITSSTAK